MAKCILFLSQRLIVPFPTRHSHTFHSRHHSIWPAPRLWPYPFLDLWLHWIQKIFSRHSRQRQILFPLRARFLVNKHYGQDVHPRQQNKASARPIRLSKHDVFHQAHKQSPFACVQCHGAKWATIPGGKFVPTAGGAGPISPYLVESR